MVGVNELYDINYELKKDISILTGKLVLSEFIFKKSVDNIIHDFYNSLSNFKRELKEYHEEQIHNYSLLYSEIIRLRKRRTDIKQSINLSEFSITYCEKEIGICINNS